MVGKMCAPGRMRWSTGLQIEDERSFKRREVRLWRMQTEKYALKARLARGESGSCTRKPAREDVRSRLDAPTVKLQYCERRPLADLWIIDERTSGVGSEAAIRANGGVHMRCLRCPLAPPTHLPSANDTDLLIPMEWRLQRPNGGERTISRRGEMWRLEIGEAAVVVAAEARINGVNVGISTRRRRW